MMRLDSWYQQIPYPLVMFQAIDYARLYFKCREHVASSWCRWEAHGKQGKLAPAIAWAVPLEHHFQT
jgi:hypothetical protein